MRSDAIVIIGVKFQNPAQMFLAQDNGVVQTLAPDRSDKLFGNAILREAVQFSPVAAVTRRLRAMGIRHKPRSIGSACSTQMRRLLAWSNSIKPTTRDAAPATARQAVQLLAFSTSPKGRRVNGPFA
jgi:hypothetical protein